MDLDWNAELREQLESHWQDHLRPRLAGLTDDEYFWEPVPGCWNVRRRGESAAPMAVGGGEFTMDYAQPEPSPPPVTTIAWRLAHIIVGLFGWRNEVLFGGPPASYQTFEYAGTAADALDQLDAGYADWIKGVRTFGLDGLTQPSGPAAGPYAASPMAALVLHINREVIHHGAEILLLRDLYLRKDG
jgi:DinB superfamily